MKLQPLAEYPDPAAADLAADIAQLAGSIEACSVRLRIAHERQREREAHRQSDRSHSLTFERDA